MKLAIALTLGIAIGWMAHRTPRSLVKVTRQGDGQVTVTCVTGDCEYFGAKPDGSEADQ